MINEPKRLGIQHSTRLLLEQEHQAMEAQLLSSYRPSSLIFPSSFAQMAMGDRTGCYRNNLA